MALQTTFSMQQNIIWFDFLIFLKQGNYKNTLNFIILLKKKHYETLNQKQVNNIKNFNILSRQKRVHEF